MENSDSGAAPAVSADPSAEIPLQLDPDNLADDIVSVVRKNVEDGVYRGITTRDFTIQGLIYIRWLRQHHPHLFPLPGNKPSKISEDEHMWKVLQLIVGSALDHKSVVAVFETFYCIELYATLSALIAFCNIARPGQIVVLDIPADALAWSSRFITRFASAELDHLCAQAVIAQRPDLERALAAFGVFEAYDDTEDVARMLGRVFLESVCGVDFARCERGDDAAYAAQFGHLLAFPAEEAGGAPREKTLYAHPDTCRVWKNVVTGSTLIVTTDIRKFPYHRFEWSKAVSLAVESYGGWWTSSKVLHAHTTDLAKIPLAKRRGMLRDVAHVKVNFGAWLKEMRAAAYRSLESEDLAALAFMFADVPGGPEDGDCGCSNEMSCEDCRGVPQKKHITREKLNRAFAESDDEKCFALYLKNGMSRRVAVDIGSVPPLVGEEGVRACVYLRKGMCTRESMLAARGEVSKENTALFVEAVDSTEYKAVHGANSNAKIARIAREQVCVAVDI